MNMLQKALSRGLTPANIISYASLQIMTRWGRFFGTLRLRCKAALLGVPVGSGVTAHGPVGLMRWPGSHITIGAGVTYTEFEPFVLQHFPEALDYWRRIGGWQVRNAGTIGGNVANGSPIGETPPLLIALDARMISSQFSFCGEK